MVRRSAHRLATTLWLVCSMLFAQLALANYMCPEQGGAAPMPEMMAAGMPCEGMDADQPALCAEHSAASPQSVEAAKVPTLSVPMVVQVLALPMVLDAAAAGALPPAAMPEGQPPPDPIFLSTRRLRV